MEMIKLVETIEDYRDFLEVVEESVDGKKHRYLEGVWAQAELINANRRMYQLKEMISEMNRFNESIIPKKRALGELDHSNESQILLHRASHIFETPLSMDGNNLVGRARVLDTAYGQTLGVLIDEKIPFGVSSKGMGKLSKKKKDGKIINLVSSFQMRSPGDVVYSQSAPDAIPNIIIEMVMSQDTRIQNIFGYELTESLRKKINKIKRYELEEAKKDAFNRLMNFDV